MALKKIKNLRRKKVLIILSLALVFLTALYLNRSYARIFDYDKSRPILLVPMENSYILENGQGSEKIKYVALGDSLTYGLGAKGYESTFPYILANKFLNKNKSVEVINIAVPGAKAKDVLNSQVDIAVRQKPDFVTLMIGTNDVHNYVDPVDFETELEQIIKTLKTNVNTKILVINIPYLGTGSLILFPYNQIMNSRIQDFNRIIKRVAEKEDVGYFDLYTASYKTFQDSPDLYYSVDQFHPSAEGYILWGNLIDAN